MLTRLQRWRAELDERQRQFNDNAGRIHQLQKVLNESLRELEEAEYNHRVTTFELHRVQQALYRHRRLLRELNLNGWQTRMPYSFIQQLERILAEKGLDPLD